MTVLRAYAENVAVVFWVNRKPEEFEKLRPGATQRLPIGKVVAEAERHLPGFKVLYDLWSDHAHPSGAGAFHTLKFGQEAEFTWQSHPNFRSVDDARQVLEWLDALCILTTRVIGQTLKNRQLNLSPEE